jgi:hypothetical protein
MSAYGLPAGSSDLKSRISTLITVESMNWQTVRSTRTPAGIDSSAPYIDRRCHVELATAQARSI